MPKRPIQNWKPLSVVLRQEISLKELIAHRRHFLNMDQIASEIPLNMHTGSFIDQAVCQKCMICTEVCPSHIPGTDHAEAMHFIPERIHVCIECGQCMAACSKKAVHIAGLTYERDFKDLPEKGIDYPGFVDFLATRRSVRNFKNKPVPDNTIKKIVEAVSFAPFGAEPEKMCLTIVNNRKTIASALPHMADFLDNIVKWIENPFVSYIIRRRNSRETFNTIRNHLYPIAKLGNYKLDNGDRITRNAPAMIILHADRAAEEHTRNAMIYATYLMLAAHSLGLGATMIGLVPAAINKVKKVREIFRIPQSHEATISIIFGYPKYKYQRSIRRRSHRIHWIE